MIKKVFLILFVFVFSLMPVFAQEQEKTKKYDLMFSLSGGKIAGQFSLAGNFLYAQEFGIGFFQMAGFANLNKNVKEYGGSIGLGVHGSDPGQQGVHFYLFADSLYSYEKLWLQVRPTLRVGFSWLSFMGFYALPITRDSIQIDNQEIIAAKYYGGEMDIVPFNWLRIYGNVMSTENTSSRYSIGAEVRFFKYVSLSADWNRADAGFYSNWTNYQDFRISLNVLFGTQQQSFRPTQSKAVPVFYPVLVVKQKEKPKPEPEKVEFHSYWVEYHVKPEWLFVHGRPWTMPIYVSVSTDHAKYRMIKPKLVNDCLWIGELDTVECRKSFDNRTFDFYTSDTRREPNHDPDHPTWMTYGDIFVLVDKETGVRTQLTNVIQNTHGGDRLPDAKMARCWILSDGTVSNTPPAKTNNN